MSNWEQIFRNEQVIQKSKKKSLLKNNFNYKYGK